MFENLRDYFRKLWKLITGFRPVNPMDPNKVEIGPIVNGENYSLNMPLHPSPHPEGWVIEMPYPTQQVGSVHYVTWPTGSLVGKKRMTLRFRVEGGKFVPRNFPNNQASLSLHFQRYGDKWTADYEDYRWYASFATVKLTGPGEYTVEARFDQNWTAVLRSSREKNIAAYNDALENAHRIGFVLGGGDGLGHGIYALGPSRIVVTGIAVE